MRNLKAIQFYSGTLPSEQTVTLHSGNECTFEDADAEYLLREFPDRFEELAIVDLGEVTLPPQAETPESVDPSLETKVVEVPAEIEQFGAQAGPTLKRGKKGK